MSKHPHLSSNSKSFHTDFADCRRLAILPGHGSYKYYTRNKAQKWLQFHMLVSSTRYRKDHEDLKTKKKFKAYHRKIIYTHKWGHLIFQVPHLH